jgi:transcriptional regulator with GAF, ATPase, and Fis domain
MMLQKREIKFIFFSLFSMLSGVFIFWQFYFKGINFLNSQSISISLSCLSFCLCIVLAIRFCRFDSEEKKFRNKTRDYQIQMNVMNQRFQKTGQEFEAFLESCHAFSTDLQIDEICQKVIHIVDKNLGADQGSVMLLNEENKLKIKTCLGLSESVVRETELALGERVSGMAIEAKHDFLILGDLADHPLFKDVGSHSRIQSAMICPIVFKDTIYGTLNVCRTIRSELYTSQDLEKAKFLAKQIGLALHHAELAEQIEVKRHEMEETFYGLKESQMQIINFYQNPTR